MLDLWDLESLLRGCGRSGGVSHVTETWGRNSRGGAAQSYSPKLSPPAVRPSLLCSHAPAQQLTFALVIDDTAGGHREKAEGIDASAKEETCVGSSLWLCVGGLLRRLYSRTRGEEGVQELRAGDSP